MAYNYFIPLIHLGPIQGYIFIQEIPLDAIKQIIIGKNAKLEVIRKVIEEKEIIYENKEIINLKDNNWLNKKGAHFRWKSSLNINKIPYIETQMNLLKGKGFRSSSMPSFYVNYISPKNKNYISCGNEKYGNPRVIMQMQEFGTWIDGYPAINVDYDNKTTYTLIIINPYKTPNSFFLEINSLKIKNIIKVGALSVKKINFIEIIKKKKWTGQFFIYGKKRAIVYLISHDYDNIKKVSTLEHSDPFRAELTYQPRFQYLRNQIHKKMKKIFNS